jgi:Tol biopolymer transport system component
MKGLTFVAIAVCIIFQGAGTARQAEFPVLSGPYLGQKPPGMTPEVFAPGVVSREGIQMKLTMTADGSEILYTERDPATNAASFILRRRVGNSWSEPLVLPYSKEYMDIEPSLSPDGKRILFVSNRPLSGLGEPEKMPDIWMAEKTGDQWGSPIRLGPPVLADDPADIEAHPAFFPDGGIYFMRQNGKTRRLFQVARRGDAFDAPAPIPLKEDLLVGQFSGPCLSPDGRTLLMHSRKEGGFGNWDLYVAFKDESGGWGELRNLGPVVNTDKPESNPTLSPDGRFLLFTRETDIHWVSTKIIEGLRPKEAGKGASR